MTIIAEILDVVSEDDAWLTSEDDDLLAEVVPQQVDEFTCSTCFLIQHRTQLASTRGGQPICRDCT